MIDGAFISDGLLGPAHDWVRRTADATRAAGGLYVADEVQAGFGRTGDALWSVAAAGVTPDFITLGKPMGNGFPVAAVITRAELADPFIAATDYFSTFGGNTVAAAAGLAVLRVIEEEGLIERARERGAHLRARLEAIPGLGAVRAWGLMAGVDVGAERAGRIVNALRDRGVLIGQTGPDGGTLKLRPPLIVSDRPARPAGGHARRCVLRQNGVSSPPMSELAVFWHDDVLLHDTGAGLFETGPNEFLDVPELHPENDVRIRNMRSLLTRGPLAPHLDWQDGRHATEAELALVHDPAYVTSIKRQMAAGGGRGLQDGHTVISEHSWRAAAAAAGTALAAADAVLEGDTRVSLALVRPPGHHAQPAVADGYCFFNNAALAAERARRAGSSASPIVDWDVHHGNGTQECFYDRRDVLTVSLHMRTGLWSPTHVQTGSPEEVGRDAGQGFNVNVELPVGSGDQAYELAMRRIVAPVLEQFRPGLIVGAAGQDASGFDPNGRQNVSMDGFRAIGAALGDAARELCDGRLVLVQEGGYARTYAAFCLHATLEGVLGLAPLLADPLGYIPDDLTRARTSVESVQSALSRYWRMPLPA